MEKLYAQLEEIEKSIPALEKVNDTVSSAAVGWHLEHSLLTIENICNAAISSDPKYYKPSFKLIKHIILFTGKIPRGRAKAPKTVTPTAKLNIQQLKDHLQTTRNLLESLPTLERKNHFDHPFFGHLNKKTTIKFLGIHTNHHLAIVRDILKSSTSVS